MVRLTRAETQERNRAGVLAAARSEFAKHGFREAKIDRIADRAELTRGAVYSNFPGKRALYFAVLADAAEHEPHPSVDPGLTVREALGVFARAWVARLPMASDDRHGLGVDLIPEVAVDELTRRPFAQLMALDAILLGLALERLDPAAGRLVRVAEAALTTLHGATALAWAAPGFGEIFHVVRACEQLADLATGDHWPESPIDLAPALVDESWTPPTAPTDLLTGAPAPLTGDGVVAVLGLHRLAAVEQAVRAGADVTAVLVTAHPDELAPLARLTVAELRACLRQAVPESAWPRLRVVCDERGFLAAAAGLPTVDDDTEAAIRVESGRIVRRAEGYGACHAAATPSTAPRVQPWNTTAS
ncbi:helix-turn-helix domain-containing protein [Umezawaea sp. Da 62-37]|uniref:TetR/AcrR family transcriptional regulator n=1 Tax=Umezawaea sp. Da 62-37 TaxID=3075927 RepID=UPI0028F707E1|nr:helix-turn-helix domain-containing protein [Umezawaea sp. Da 62-37]WNV86541.1 helix-turn-helix domain-containing protein [Umezawaea sp. Da 62-37]